MRAGRSASLERAGGDITAAGQFTAVLSIADDGRVQAIEFETVRD